MDAKFCIDSGLSISVVNWFLKNATDKEPTDMKNNELGKSTDTDGLLYR